MRPLPLEGVLVVALEHAVAAPFATRQLAELGARVIKIERPGSGDFARGYDTRVRGQSSHFIWCNRSKQSLALDLKHPLAAEVLARLLQRADVLVQNLAPGAAARLGLIEARLRARYPRLVYCEISGYGAGGPYGERKAYDLLVQAEAGLVSVTGTAAEPAKAGISVADIAAGMYAYSSILAALLQRERSGQGSHIEVSMLESLAEWMGYPMYYAFDGAEPPARTGVSHSTIAPYGRYAVGDGGSVIFGLQNEREWPVFCQQVLGESPLAADPRFVTAAQRAANREALRIEIERCFSRRSTPEVTAALEAAGIASARLNAMRDLWAHPQLQARDRWRQVGTPAGAVPALRPPGLANDCEARIGPVPGVGEHSAAILRELGFDPAQLAALCGA